MIPGARLLILGRQGAGKGTQCVRLSRHYVVPHISTGDMLRAAVREGSALGEEALRYMDGGELLPDDVMIGIVEERLAKDDTSTRGYILDGFPRTVAQAEALVKITSERPIHVVIDLDVPRDVVVRRLASRRTCQDCGTIYTASGRERLPWICDVCGGDVVQRNDDTEEAIHRRLDLYESQTSPLIGYYEAIGLLEVVDGVGSQDDVLDRMVKVVEARRSGQRRPAPIEPAPTGPGATVSLVRRTAGELAAMRRAGRVVAEMHEAIGAAIGPGVTTAELDAVGREVLDRRGARSNFLGYHGFPAVICASVNDDGDPRHPGRPGAPTRRSGVDRLRRHRRRVARRRRLHHGCRRGHRRQQRLLDAAWASLAAGVDAMQPDGQLSDIGAAVQTVVEGAGFAVVRDYCGHGIGRAMHERPDVPNYGRPGRGPRLAPGVVLAVEPMLTAGRAEVDVLDDGWGVVSVDGSLTAHVEHTIAITDDGPEILTARNQDRPPQARRSARSRAPRRRAGAPRGPPARCGPARRGRAPSRAPPSGHRPPGWLRGRRPPAPARGRPARRGPRPARGSRRVARSRGLQHGPAGEVVAEDDATQQADEQRGRHPEHGEGDSWHPATGSRAGPPMPLHRRRRVAEAAGDHLLAERGDPLGRWRSAGRGERLAEPVEQLVIGGRGVPVMARSPPRAGYASATGREPGPSAPLRPACRSPRRPHRR